MEEIWIKLYEAAKAVQKEVRISKNMTAGEVSAAIESSSGKIYTGVCVDTACSLGVCAERNAMFNMITSGEYKIRRVLSIMPDGSTASPCGACREFMMQLMGNDYKDVEVMADYSNNKVVKLSELTPDWWTKGE